MKASGLGCSHIVLGLLCIFSVVLYALGGENKEDDLHTILPNLVKHLLKAAARKHSQSTL